jgi:hypothetical protein
MFKALKTSNLQICKFSANISPTPCQILYMDIDIVSGVFVREGL